KLPGPGTIYLGQTLKFLKPVLPQDRITAKVVVKEKIPEKKMLILDCSCENQRGEIVISGEAKVIAPSRNIIREQKDLGSLHLQKPVNELYYTLYDKVKEKLPLKTAVICPTSKQTWDDTLQLAKLNLIDPVIIASKEELKSLGSQRIKSIEKFEYIDVKNHKEAVNQSVKLSLDNKIDALLNGFVETQ